MTPLMRRSIRTLAAALDRTCIVKIPARHAMEDLIALAAPHPRIQSASEAWDGEPVHVPTLPIPDYQTHVELVGVRPALLDPAGNIIG